MSGSSQQGKRRLFADLGGASVAESTTRKKGKPAAKAKASQAQQAAFQSGFCTCMACEGNSKETLATHKPSLSCLVKNFLAHVFSAQMDLKWALYTRATDAPEPIALEDKCEGCYTAWQQAYSHMEWDAFAEKSKTQKDFKEQVSLVKRRLQAGIAPMKGPAVGKITGYEIEVSRLFMGASEREIKQKLSQARLNKWQTRGVPSITIPSETGGSETCYLFKHPQDDGLREVRFKCKVAVNSDEIVLDHNRQHFEEQALGVFDNCVSGYNENLGQLFSQRDFPLMAHDDFIKERGGKQDPEALEVYNNEPSGLIAAAAAAADTQNSLVLAGGHTVDGPVTPTPKQSHRSPSQVGEDQSAVTGVSDEVAGDEEELLKWQTKCDPSEILLKQNLGRSLRGLEECIRKLKEKDDKRMLQTALEGVYTLADTANTFAKLNILTAPDVELQKTLSIFKANSVKLPFKMAQQVLQRRVNDLSSKGEYAAILQILNIFHAKEPFDLLEPKLCGLDTDFQTQVKTMTAIIFEKVLVDWLRAGASSSQHVQDFSRQALALYSEVDLVDLDAVAAKELSEQQTLFKAL
eukprot:6458552-Amphidinium_carterae.1